MADEQNLNLGDDLPRSQTDEPEVEGHMVLDPAERVSGAAEDISMRDEGLASSPEDIAL